MDKVKFESDVDIAHWQDEVGEEAFVNTWSVKGPVVILRCGEPFAIWTDKKTAGYPLEVMVNTLVLTGGNWQGEPYPLDVLKRERKEELKVGDEVLGLTFTPFADYFTGIPAATIRQAGRGGYCDCSSIHVAEVDEKKLYDAVCQQRGNLVKLVQVLNMTSTEAKQAIIPVQALINRTHPYPFGFGDGRKVYDVLREKYNLSIPLGTQQRDLEGVDVVRLPSMPSESFESRREVIEAYQRRGNNPFFGAVTDASVFGK